jgi:threonylcarbamoyladenosine tRNA methylthiotransferase MtaB
MKMQHFSQLHEGEVRKVLFEAYNKNGMMEGYSDNYIRVTAPYRTELANKIADWKL